MAPVIAREPGSGVQTPVKGTLDHIKIIAPLKGTVNLKVSERSLVKEGDVIAVQVSTKTELQIMAPKAGFIKNLVGDGQVLEENDLVAELEAS